jgi:photosystem II stability/assembly factor-like uncharacterized protein
VIEAKDYTGRTFAGRGKLRWRVGSWLTLALLTGLSLPPTLPASAAVVTGVGSWPWLDPLPQGNDLMSVACPTSTNCLAVGDVGTIMRSADGGKKWSSVRSPTNEPFAGVSCASPTICYAVAGQRLYDLHDWIVFGTSDGGASWARLASGSSHLNGLSCPSTTTCFAAGGEPYGSGEIAATKDGGNTWTVEATPPGDIYAIACASATTCIAVGGGNGWPTLIYATTNGGETWSKENSSAVTTLYSVACPSTTTCYTVGLNASVTGSPTILGTTNGGVNWVSENSNSPAINLKGITCPSVTRCVAVGGGPATVLATIDAGSTWSTENIPPGAKYGLESVSCWTSAECLAVGDFGTLIDTKDAGANWAADMSWSGVGTSGRIKCPSPAHCVTTAGSHAFSTLDGGLSWTDVAAGSQPNNPLSAIDCPDDLTCYASLYYDSSGLISHDGGLSWTATQGGSGFEDISCPSATTCYAVTYGSIAFCVITDGASWSCPHGVPRVPRAISCPAVLTCYVTGQPTYKTTDGGVTWIPQQAGLDLTAIDCPAVTTCFASGPGGVFFTTDGVNWSSFSSDVMVYSGAVSCPTTSTCYVSGGSLDNILVTTDAGLSWSVRHSGDSGGGDISCPTVQICFAIGHGLTTSALQRPPRLLPGSMAPAGNGLTRSRTGAPPPVPAESASASASQRLEPMTSIAISDISARVWPLIRELLLLLIGAIH